MDKPLRISRLIETDFMGVRSLDIRPGRKCLIILRGKNESGKTSTLMGIICALGGKSFDPEKPIRDGAENGIVDITLADDVADRLRVSASWTPSGRYMTLRSIEEGGETKISSPQSAIDDIVGALTFDPLKFMRLKPAEQLEMIMHAIGKAQAYADLQKRRQTYFDERTIINRQIKDKDALLRVKINPAPGEVLTFKGTDEVKKSLDEAVVINNEIDAYAKKLDDFEKATTRLMQDNGHTEREIEELEKKLEAARNILAANKAAVADRKEKEIAARAKLEQMKKGFVDSTAIAARMDAITAHNNRVQQQQEYTALVSSKKSLQYKVDELEQSMKTIDVEVHSLISSSDLGQRVPGLSITVTGDILYNKIPLEQASGMRKLDVSTQVGMAANKQLHVMAIDEGDKLDPESLDRLKQIAQERDYQFWMTACYAGKGDDLEKIVEMADGTSTDNCLKPAAAQDAEIAGMYDGLPSAPQPIEHPINNPIDLSNFDL